MSDLGHVGKTVVRRGSGHRAVTAYDVTHQTARLRAYPLNPRLPQPAVLAGVSGGTRARANAGAAGSTCCALCCCGPCCCGTCGDSLG